MTKSHVEIIEHSGDTGLRISADSLPQLLITAAEQMVRICCPEDEIHTVVTRAVSVTGHDLVELMVNWLSEINTVMALHHELYVAFEINEVVSEGAPPLRLSGSMQGEPIDSDRHHIAVEIKAVTFGEAYLRRKGIGWEGQVIFDI